MEWPLIFCLSRVSEVRLGVEGTLDLGPWTLGRMDLELDWYEW